MKKINFDGEEAIAEYCGDGVYAIYDGSCIWLYANSHIKPTDKICLEPETLNKFKDFLEEVVI